MKKNPKEIDGESEFPTLVYGDTERPLPDLLSAAQCSFQQGLELLKAIARLDRGGEAHWDKQMASAAEVLQALAVRRLRDPGEIAAQNFAATLKARREQAGLTQERLAGRAGLSLSLIKKMEQGTKKPGPQSLAQLLGIDELRLSPAEAQLSSDPLLVPQCFAPNWWVAPHFDPVGMLADLIEQLNGGGGYIEQTCSYLDHESALDFIALANQPHYVTAYRNKMPLDAMARAILSYTRDHGIDFIALGSGDGKQEVLLVQHLAASLERPDVRFYLLDISQPLLSVAFRHAMDTLNDRHGVFVCALQGNFHHLPRYMQLHYTPARWRRRRLLTMFGYTLANVVNEQRFIRDSLIGAGIGDLLLVDIQLAYGSPSQPDEIRRLDPGLRYGITGAHAHWLGGPIRRYCRDVQEVKYECRLDVDCPVPGSYALEVVAHVKLAGNRERRFVLGQTKRYAPGLFAEYLRGLGWARVAYMPFGPEETPIAALGLYRKEQTV